ncbi:hypothetical protein LINPERPRIM_LOCUS21064, partial [Linum perenne]
MVAVACRLLRAGLGAGLLGGRPCELRRSCLGQVSRVGCRSTEWHWGS